MPKPYLNGCMQSKFIVLNTSLTEIELSIDFQEYIESVEEKYIEHELFNGEYLEEFQYAHYFFTFDYSELVNAQELTKWKALLNYLQLGFSLQFFPHKELDRSFIVTTVKDKYSLKRLPGHRLAKGHGDFKIELRTKYPITAKGQGINWLEIGDDNVNIGVIFNQYDLLADVNGALLLDENGLPLISKCA